MEGRWGTAGCLVEGCFGRGTGHDSAPPVAAAGCSELAPAPHREPRCRHSRWQGARRGSWWSWRAGPRTPTAWLRTPRWVWGGGGALLELEGEWVRDALGMPGWALSPLCPPSPCYPPAPGSQAAVPKTAPSTSWATHRSWVSLSPPPPPPQGLPMAQGVAHGPPPCGQAGGVRRSGCPCTPWATSS